MTTRGDNRKLFREEAERLRLVRFPQRAAALTAEFAWSCKMPVPADFSPPPLWVKYCVRHYFGVPDSRVPPGKIDGEMLARLLGEGQGVLTASIAAMNRSVADPSGPNAGKIELFRQRMATAMLPQWDTLKKELAAFPEEKLAKNLDLLVAMYDQEAAASADIRRQVVAEEIEGGITQSILFYLWMFWAEVETTKSVAQLHQWFLRMDLVACNLKLFQKVCTRIGLRKSARGRKKRISTPAR